MAREIPDRSGALQFPLDVVEDRLDAPADVVAYLADGLAVPSVGVVQCPVPDLDVGVQRERRTAHRDDEVTRFQFGVRDRSWDPFGEVDVQFAHDVDHLRVHAVGRVGAAGDDIDAVSEPSLGPLAFGEGRRHLGAAGVLHTDEGDAERGCHSGSSPTA